MWLYSDRGIVKDFAKMDGFGVNTFVWVNGKGERFYVKYRFTAHNPSTSSTEKKENALPVRIRTSLCASLHRRLAFGRPDPI